MRILTTLIAAIVALGSASIAHAAYPSNFNQGFETDITGWNFSSPTLWPTRVASGTDGITSSSGSFHAVVNPGTFLTPSGAATNFGGYTNQFPTGGYTTSLDIYLDPEA